MEYQFLKEMGWSYRDLIECPEERLRSYMAIRNTLSTWYKKEADGVSDV